MTVAFRNLQEKDLESIRGLLFAQIGPSLANLSQLQPENLKSFMLAEGSYNLTAEEAGSFTGSASILMIQEVPEGIAGLLCRLCVTDSPSRVGLTKDFIGTAVQSFRGNLRALFSEALVRDSWIQNALEQAGFVPAGYLPQKFRLESRENAIVYSFLSEAARNARRPHPEIISGAKDLAAEVLKAHGFNDDIEVREDVLAYPTECNFSLVPMSAEAAQPFLLGKENQQPEIFQWLQDTQTCLHLPSDSVTYMAAKEGDQVVGIIGYILDSVDRRVQIVQITTLEREPQGFMVALLLEKLTQQGSVDYWEVLVSAHAPRMQKTFDQVGFVACAYLPAFMAHQGLRSDTIKMVKLNLGYEKKGKMELTHSSEKVFSIIDTVFQEHRIGTAMLKLLRDLRIFRGMGEGELRRVTRLFSQKLFRPGEIVFEEGSTGQELYIVERGEIEIQSGGKVLGTIRNGAVLGEIAFLNGEARTAKAISKTASILRVIQRPDFDRLIQREMHLGMIFFQNVSLDLVNKLKQSNVAAKK